MVSVVVPSRRRTNSFGRVGFQLTEEEVHLRLPSGGDQGCAELLALDRVVDLAVLLWVRMAHVGFVQVLSYVDLVDALALL